MLIDSKFSEIVSSYIEKDKSSSVIFDLRNVTNFIVYPLQSSYERCKCKETPVPIINHCYSCGATNINLKSGVPSYDLYSSLYKAMDILRDKIDTFVFISKEYIPTDFVGSLNRVTYTYLEEFPYRRNIMHISNDLVHNECFFVQEGIIDLKRDILTHITVFSGNKEVLKHHTRKIVHASKLEPLEYTNLILSSAGVTENYLIS